MRLMFSIATCIPLLVSGASGDVTTGLPGSCDPWLDLSSEQRYQVCLRDSAKRPESEVGSIRALCLEASEYSGDDLSDDLFKGAKFLPRYGESKFQGLVVSNVEAGSPLQHLGIQDGDLIVEINGIPLDRPAIALELVRQLARSRRVESAFSERAISERSTSRSRGHGHAVRRHSAESCVYSRTTATIAIRLPSAAIA
jgi:hypothetical protein